MEDKATVTKPQKRLIIRIFKWVLILIPLLILLAFFLFPVAVSSERGRKFILAKIDSSIEGNVDFTSLSMGWRKGVTITNLSFEDDAEGIRVTVKQVSTQPHYVSLLSGNPSFGETVIDTPVIEIDLPEAEPVETSDSQPKTSGEPESSATGVALANIDLVIKEGNLKVTRSQAELVELAQINVKLNLKPLGKASDFDMNMAVIHEDKASKIRATGQMTPGTKSKRIMSPL